MNVGMNDVSADSTSLGLHDSNDIVGFQCTILSLGRYEQGNPSHLRHSGFPRTEQTSRGVLHPVK